MLYPKTGADGGAGARAGLAENRCLSRYATGARLLQVGEQDLTLGIKFRARVVLDIAEHAEGLRPELIDDRQVRV